MLLATPPTSPSTFPAFLEAAFERGTSARSTREHALDFGVDEAALIRYANGAVSVYEHAEIQNVLASNDWARTYVVNLVKSKRVQRNAA